MTQYWIQLKSPLWNDLVTNPRLMGNSPALIAYWESGEVVQFHGDDVIGRHQAPPCIVLTKDESHDPENGMPYQCAQLGLNHGLVPQEGTVRIIVHDGHLGALANANKALCRTLHLDNEVANAIGFLQQSNTVSWLNGRDHTQPYEPRYTGACVAMHLLCGPYPVSERVERALGWLARLENAWTDYR